MGLGIVAQVLQQIHDMLEIWLSSILDKTDLNYQGFRFDILVMIVIVSIGVSVVWNLGEWLFLWVKSGGFMKAHDGFYQDDGKGAYGSGQLKKILLGVFFCFLVNWIRPLATFPDGGELKNVPSAMGVNYYSGIFQGLKLQNLNQVVQAIGAVDLVGKWNAALVDARISRRQVVIKELAKTDPSLAQAIQAKLDMVPYADGGIAHQSSFQEWWSNLKSLATLALDIMVPSNWSKVSQMLAGTLVLKATQSVLNLIVGFATLIWTIGIIRVIALYSVFLKIAALFSTILLPVFVGLAYFESFRGFAVRAISNMAVILVMAGALGPVVQSVLSDSNLKTMTAISLAQQIDPNRPVTDNDIFALKMSFDMDRVDDSAMSAEDPGAFMGITLTELFGSVSALFRVMFIIGLLGHVLVQLFSIIGGVMEGRYDPWAAAAPLAKD